MSEEENLDLKEFAAKFLEKCPKVGKVYCEFCGSGDCFSEFSEIIIFDRDNLEIGIEDEYSNMLETLFFKIMDADGRAYFDNDGSSGTIEVDFIKGKVKVEIFYYELVKNSDGENEYEDLIDPKIFQKPMQDLSNFVKLKKKKKAEWHEYKICLC